MACRSRRNYFLFLLRPWHAEKEIIFYFFRDLQTMGAHAEAEEIIFYFFRDHGMQKKK